MAITLTPDQANIIEGAIRAGLVQSVDQFIETAVEALRERESPKRRHISQVILENMRRVPQEILDSVPRDAASEHDHYIYGLPKKNS